MKKTEEQISKLNLVNDSEEAHQLTTVDDVPTLQPDGPFKAMPKSLEPSITEIMPTAQDKVELEADWGQTKKNIPIGWLISGALLMGGLTLWSLITVFKGQPEPQIGTTAKKEILQAYEQEDKEIKKNIALVEDCISSYLLARSVEELLPHVRHPNRVKPLMNHYYSQHVFTPKKVNRIAHSRALALDNRSFILKNVILTNGQAKSLLIEQIDSNTFKIDWETDVYYQPVAWDKYLTEKPTEAMNMRVSVTPDNFYSYEFRDESQFQCYKLTSLKSNRHLFGYVERTSDVARQLEEKMMANFRHGGGEKEPMILRLRFPKNSKSKQCVMIEKLLAARWTYVTDPNQ